MTDCPTVVVGMPPTDVAVPADTPITAIGSPSGSLSTLPGTPALASTPVAALRTSGGPSSSTLPVSGRATGGTLVTSTMTVAVSVTPPLVTV